MVKELYRNLALILAIVVGVGLFWLYMNTQRESESIRQNNDLYRQQIDSLIQERDSFLRESGRLGREIDSMSIALEQSKRSEQLIKQKYAQLRRDLTGYTTDEHIVFLADQLSE